MAKRSPMSSLQASRTLVKSPPELWAELSDLGSLARHLGEFGEIRITKTDPESRVEWEADRASGTVRLEPSGWGTRVVLTVDTPEPAADPEPEPEEAPVAEAEPEAVQPDPHPEPLAEEPVMEPAAAVEEPKRGFWARLFGRKKPVEPAPAPEPVAVEPEPEPVAAAPEPVVAEPEPEPAPVREDRIEQPTWRIFAPDPTATPGPVPGTPPAAPGPAQIQASAEPQWPARPDIEESPSMALLANRAVRSPSDDLWAASAREVMAPVGETAPTAGIQPCSNCGLSLSSTARFCRRCGTRQG